MTPTLSILICSLDRRKHLLDRLVECLRPQLSEAIEVLVETDDGLMTIGEKRNLLVSRSSGRWVCFVDDDDLVSDDYCPSILKALESEPDCVGFIGRITVDGNERVWKHFHHSIRNTSWFEKNGHFFRCPNHLNPIRRELVVQVPFPHRSFGEDHDFSLRIYPLLKSEVFIDKVLYRYLFRKQKTV